MKTLFSLRTGALTLAALLFFGGGTAPRAEAADYKLQTFWSAGSAPFAVLEDFAESMRIASGGEVNITVLPEGAIVAYNQSLHAVSSGILEMQKSTPCYFSGIDAALGLLCEINAGYSSAYQFVTWYYQGGGLELARKIYADHGLYFIGPVPLGVESIPTKEPIRSVADFENVKIRMPEGPSSELFRAIGAVPVNVHGSEVYTSLEKGVVSATDWGTISVNESLGYHKVAPYAIYPGIHSVPMGDLSMNLDLWNSLDPATQELLEVGVRTMAIDMLQTVEKADADVLATAEERGITIIDWSAEERLRLREAAQEVWKSIADKSPLAREVYDSQVAWLRLIGQVD